MAQLATKTKKTIRKELDAAPNRTSNKAGGEAFTIENPAQDLLNTVGSSLFNEPKYYPDDKNLEEYKLAGFNIMGLDEQAVRIINSCIEVASSDHPQDLLSIAHWCRKEMHMRTTPAVMLAVAAKCSETKTGVRLYAKRICQRPDDIKQVIAAYEHLFGWKGFPACLKKGAADVLHGLSERDFLKYNTDGHPSWKDLLLFVERRKGFPVSKPVFEYLVNGKIEDPEKVPVFAAHKKLTALKQWTKDVPALARRAGATWELLVSQFGGGKEVWEAMAPQMGYMALLRNLNNFIKADVSDEVVDMICRKLGDKKKVLESKQLPFRFLSAYQAVAKDNFNVLVRGQTGSMSTLTKNERSFLFAIEKALDASTENLPKLEGVTALVIDASASMNRVLSEKSSLSIKDAAFSLAGCLHSASVSDGKSSVRCFLFADRLQEILLSKKCSAIMAIKEMSRVNVGCSTFAHLAFDHLLASKECVDRVILLSDMQCFSLGRYGESSTVAEALTRYRREVNKNCFLHSVNLASQDNTAQVPTGKKYNKLNNIMSGFSPNIVRQFKQFEIGDSSAVEKPTKADNEIPSLDYIRANY